MANSNSVSGARKVASDKPAQSYKHLKPYPKFPLSAHPSGYWQKKITLPGRKPKIHYFGRWGKLVNGKMEIMPNNGAWQEALALWNAQQEDIYKGRTPRVQNTVEGLTLGELCSRFRTAKLRMHESGELSFRMYDEYRCTTDLIIAHFGRDRLVADLVASDFEALRAEMAKRWGPVRLGNEIQRVKTVFKYGYDNGYIEQHVRYGSAFKKPDKGVMRRHRAKNGKKMLEADQLRRLLDALAGNEVQTGQTDKQTGKPETVTLKPNPAMRAMVLLGMNCGFNNKDCADLPLTALDLKGGWIDFPRTKTGIPRRCPLWPETVEALKAAIAERPEPRQDAAKGLVFITARGRAWISHYQSHPVSVVACSTMKAVGIHREHIGFSTLRHVFRTVADGSRDQVAVNHIMGHSDNSMADVYRERIEDNRLRAVADHVRAWLFGNTVQ